MINNDQEVIALMKQLGDRQAAEKLIECRQKGRYSTTAPGSFLVGTMAGRLEAALQDWVTSSLTRVGAVYAGKPVLRMRMAQALLDLGTEKASVLACRFLVDTLIEHAGRDRVQLRKRLGQILHDEMRMTSVADVNEKRFRYVRKYLQQHGRSKQVSDRVYNFLVDEMDEEARSAVKCWEPEVQDAVAMLILVFATQMSGVFEARPNKTKTIKGRCKTIINLHLAPATLDWVKDAEQAAREIVPLNLPLVNPPKDWVSPVDGGYPDDFLGRRPLMSSRSNTQIREFAHSECPEIYDAVNSLQKVAWTVNPHVLEVFRAAVEGGWADDNLRVPGREEPPRPVCKTEDKESEEYRVWRREYRQYKHRLDTDQAEKLRCARLLYLADSYLERSFYYVHMLDFRGRCYPLSGSMQYQGDDRQRGMLRFAEGKPIGTKEAEEWFWIHGANCWGVDKVPFADRLKWAKENIKAIRDVGADPLTNRWWIGADKPWQFLAWCLEADAFMDQGPKFMSRLPIGMDGSNNGLQLYSLLLRDPVGGLATNCLPCDTPQDIYMQVAKAANAHFARTASDLTTDPDHRRWCRQLLDFWPEGLPRAAVKRPVMTLPYGSTKYACQHEISEWYHGEVRGKRLNPPPFPDRDGHQAMSYFGSIVWAKVQETVIAAVSAMRWLREVSNMATDLQRPISWATPTGLRVVQVYKKGKKKLVNLSLGKRITYWYHQPTIEIDSNRSRNGLCPNFIHSLDASLMVKVVNRMGPGISLMMIHDSFSTHAADAPHLAKVIREEAIRMFSPNLLEDFRMQVQDQLGVPIPPPPVQGSLDINQLHQAKYFFA